MVHPLSLYYEGSSIWEREGGVTKKYRVVNGLVVSIKILDTIGIYFLNKKVIVWHRVVKDVDGEGTNQRIISKMNNSKIVRVWTYNK